MAALPREHSADCRPRSSWAWIFLGFATLAVVLLWREHRVHLLGAIPYLILFACPLMHLLHRRHHRRRGRQEDSHA